MQNAVHDGNTMEYTNAGSAIAAGGVVALGFGVGVAVTAIAATTGVGTLHVRGVFLLAKTTSQTWTQGDKLYWDSGTSKFTNVASGKQAAGFADIAAGSADATGYVNLQPTIDPVAGDIQALVVAALTENSGALGGSSDGNLPDLTATAATVTGTLTGSVDGALADVAPIALSTGGGNTYSDAAVNTAVNTAITDTNLQLKELQTALNEVVADNVALRAAARENAAKINAILSSIKTAGLMASA